MAQLTYGKSDKITRKISKSLEKYESEHPHAQAALYRRNSVSVRVRIIDPEFEGISRPDRSRLVWNYLDELEEDVQADINAVILLTPDETERSMANLEFEDPTPSVL